MTRPLLCSVLSAALVALPGSAAAQTAPLAVAAPVAAPPAPPVVAPSGFRQEYYTNLAVLSMTIGAFSGLLAVPCVDIGASGGREACLWTAGGAALALVVTAIPLFVLGARAPAVTPAVAPIARRGMLAWSF